MIPMFMAALATFWLIAGFRSMPWVIGTCPMCSTPPTTKTSPCSAMIAMVAAWSACIDEPQRRLIVWALTSLGIEVMRAAKRPML